MIAAIRWRLLLYACLLLAPVLIGIQVYEGVERLRSEIDAATDLTVGGDDGVRLEVEYYRMRDGFERFVANDPGIDADEALTRFDIVRSRAAGIIDSPNFHRFSTESGIQEVAQKLLQALKAIDPVVATLERGQYTELGQMRANLLGFEQDLASSSIGFAIKRQVRGVEIRQNLADLIRHTGRMGFIVAIVVAGILVMFTLEIFCARRAEFNLGRQEEKTRFLAHHDPLTSLANRTLLSQEVEAALAKARAGHFPIYLLALDLDGFKAVNDTFGHHVGDELLKVVAGRLTKVVKTTDLVARLGGDEFAIVLRPCKSPAIVGQIATRIIEAIEQPIVVGNSEIHVSTSIGVASSLSDGDTKDALLRCADVALYEAKAAGRRTFRAFESGMDEELRRRRQLEVGLRQAIEAGDLDLHYQPQVDLASGRIFGVEALVRWTDPVHGAVAPDVFIEIASQCGMIVDLGSWVIETACRRAASWAEKGAELQIAINLSPVQLYHHNFLTMLDSVLLKTGFPSRHLTLEITEDAMIRDNEATLDMLNSLRQRGITLAIDDFGTGHSNLGYLKRLPIQYLKIDRTFVKDIETDSSDRAIIQGIIGLARSLELETIAEGVETKEQRDFLVKSGCRGAQGFFFEAALPETELLSLLDDAEPQQPNFQNMVIAVRSTVH